MENITITRDQLIDFCKAQAKLELVAMIIPLIPSYHHDVVFKALIPPPPSPSEKG